LTEETKRTGSGADVFSFREIRSAIRANFGKIALITLLAGIATAIWMFNKPNLFQASAVIAPLTDENKTNGALGALASFGLPVGGSSKLEELEALFRSDDLTVRVFRNHDLWPIIFGRDFDPKTGKLRIGWRDRLLYGRNGSVVPSDWDAIRAAEKSFTVSVNKKVSTLFIAFETLTPSGSAEIVRDSLDEAKSRLQEEALERATQNKQFLEERIAKSVDPISRDRLYTLYGQEVEREMLARNREQFGFRIIDEPRVPDRKSRPERAWNITIASLFAFLVVCAFSIMFKRKD
jgi:uncharacterized protein involved in exopolysaccharide biosynthesis